LILRRASFRRGGVIAEEAGVNALDSTASETGRDLDSEQAPRPDKVVALALPMWIETSVGRPGGEGKVSGYAIALGWNTPQNSSAYLISDDVLPRPIWVAESRVVSNSVRRPT
jgi:hypothetical protein